MKENLNETGYNQEEAYFHKKNQELIKKLRENKSKSPQTRDEETQKTKNKEQPDVK